MKRMDKEYMGICQICLRIDRKVHKTNRSNLTRFYREICKFSSETSLGNPFIQCCNQCEYMLIKMYNFKQMCLRATEILESWRNGKIKVPLYSIYKELPPSSLGLWIPNDSSVFCYQEVEFGTTTIKLEEDPDIEIHEGTQHDELPDIKDEMANFEAPQSNQVPCSSKNTSTLEATVTNKGLIKYTSIHAVTPSIIQVPESKNIRTRQNTPHNPAPELRLSRKVITPNLQVTETNNIPRTVVLPNISMTKSESTPSLHVRGGRRKQVTESKPANNKLRTSGPVLCLQDILASLAAGINQTENDLFYDEDDNTLNDGKRYKYLNMEYSKENLKKLLMELFASCNELVNCNNNEGTIIDKNFILSLLDNKMSERRMKTLWNLIYGKGYIQRDALRNLANIQNVFRNDKYESVFDIVYLTTEEEVLQEFQNRKTYKCYTDAKYKCDVCYSGFPHEKALIYHQKSHDESAGSVACDVCKKRFACRYKLPAHRSMHEIVFKCKLCPLVTIYRAAMINHFNQHNGVEHKCPGCDATFKSRSAYFTHCNNYCKTASHICTICGRKFVKESTLKAHMSTHKNEPPIDPELCVRCPHCMVGFNTERAMYRHCRFSHGERLWLTGRTSAPWRKTPEVIKIKGVRKRSICPLCNESLESIYWLKLHCTAKHPHFDFDSYQATLTPHLCHICGKAFRIKYQLKAHLDLHSGKREAFKCPDCSKIFTYQSYLTKHMAYHRPPERVCFVCGKMFKSEINLLTHMRSHKNDRRYKCHICRKGFLHAGSLKEHITGVHQKIRRVKKKRVEIAPEAIEQTVVYSGNESDVPWVHQKIRRVKRKRDEVAPEAAELVYSGNESDGNGSEDVTGVHQKIRRVKRKRDEVASKATELVYSGNESDE